MRLRNNKLLLFVSYSAIGDTLKGAAAQMLPKAAQALPGLANMLGGGAGVVGANAVGAKNANAAGGAGGGIVAGFKSLIPGLKK